MTGLSCKYVVENGTVDFDEFCSVMRRHQQTAAAADAHQAFKACSHVHTFHCYVIVVYSAYSSRSYIRYFCFMKMEVL